VRGNGVGEKMTNALKSSKPNLEGQPTI